MAFKVALRTIRAGLAVVELRLADAVQALGAEEVAGVADGAGDAWLTQ